MASLALGAMAGRAGLAVDLLARAEVSHPTSPPGLEIGPVGWVRLIQGTLQGKEPDTVALGGLAKEIACRINHHVLIALVFEDGGGSVDSRPGLILPQQLTVSGIQGREAAVVSSHEQQPARSHHRPAEADVLPPLTPNDFIGLHIQDSENAGDGNGNVSEIAPHISASIGFACTT